MTTQYEYFSATKDGRIYIDMRRSKGNTDELEKLTRNDSGLVIYVKLKKAAVKSCDFVLLGTHKESIGMHTPQKVI